MNISFLEMTSHYNGFVKFMNYLLRSSTLDSLTLVHLLDILLNHKCTLLFVAATPVGFTVCFSTPIFILKYFLPRKKNIENLNYVLNENCTIINL